MNLPVLGLTGGIGCGKSAATQFFAQEGWSVVDTDIIARALVEPGTPVWHQIRSEFGPAYFDAQDRLDRAKLAACVFSRPEALARLNGIMHPPIRAAWQKSVLECAARRQPAVVVIPLLFETGSDAELPHIAAVGCSAVLQHARLAARGWDDAQIRQRLQSQWAWSRKQARAQFILWNDGDLTLLQRQVQRLCRKWHPPQGTAPAHADAASA